MHQQYGRIRVACLIACMAFSSLAVADDEPAVVGKPAPDFTATGIDGKDIKLSEKLSGGDKNIVLLFSRANW